MTALNDRATVGFGPAGSASLFTYRPLAEAIIRLGVTLLLALPFLIPVGLAATGAAILGATWPATTLVWLLINLLIGGIGLTAGRSLEAGP